MAGLALRSQLSPDGTTLAIICAGQNSLFKASGRQVDVANSTHSTSFCTTWRGATSTSPSLSQVIKQTNAHVGLVFSPDGSTLYAAGGADDAVYVYAKSGGSLGASIPGPFIALCNSTPQQGRRPQRAAQRGRHRASPTTA